MTTILPPPFVERIKYQSCQQINDPVTRKRVYLTPDGLKTPSVTTILSATKDMTHLNEWKKRVGEAEANRITKLRGNKLLAISDFVFNYGSNKLLQSSLLVNVTVLIGQPNTTKPFSFTKAETTVWP